MRERERVRFKERGLGGYAGYTTVCNSNKCGLGHAYGNMHNLREWKCDKHPWLWSVVCAYRKTRQLWGASGFPRVKYANSLLYALCKRERLEGVAASVSRWSHGRSNNCADKYGRLLLTKQQPNINGRLRRLENKRPLLHIEQHTSELTSKLCVFASGKYWRYCHTKRTETMDATFKVLLKRYLERVEVRNHVVGAWS